jgi:hypothetical protein
MEQLDYKTMCEYVGQLFLETRHQLADISDRAEVLARRVTELARERDELLQMMLKEKQKDA